LLDAEAERDAALNTRTSLERELEVVRAEAAAQRAEMSERVDRLSGELTRAMQTAGAARAEADRAMEHADRVRDRTREIEAARDLALADMRAARLEADQARAEAERLVDLEARGTALLDQLDRRYRGLRTMCEVAARLLGHDAAWAPLALELRVELAEIERADQEDEIPF
jgi:phage protein D